MPGPAGSLCEKAGDAAAGDHAALGDADVAPAAGLKQTNTHPGIDGIVAVWVDSANAMFRQPFDDAVRAVVPHMAAYLVTESQPIPNTRFPARPAFFHSVRRSR